MTVTVILYQFAQKFIGKRQKLNRKDKMPIITLTTDFGMRDPYVAAMKGVLRKLCPDVALDDLTHDIAPQDILEAALIDEAATPWYPENTVHLIVVDPGVGADRRPIAVRSGSHIFVAPDNGLLTLWLQQHPLEWAYEISPQAPGIATISNTFHGRDIFAPAAAWLAAGGDPTALGNLLSSLQQLDVPKPVTDDDNRIEGVVIHVDRFGNCITNIRQDMFEFSSAWNVYIGGNVLPLCSTYSDVEPGTPLALFGGSGRLEIAVNQGNAARQFGFTRMTPISANLKIPC